ncbi:MipA/OmpV family protein [Falsirhodobacter sp. 1013]|uniref:MipA/OmpV family protein n=1 Tax=Falsirhodobacter sp. 1013 TaxID=3417566 RepID=UPI003EBC3141
MNQRSSHLTLLLSTALGLSAVGAGATTAQEQQQPNGFSFGFMAAGGNDVYVGDGEAALVLPAIRYQGNGFSIGFPTGIQARLFQSGHLDVSAVVRPRVFGLVDTDEQELDGIDRNVTADAGFEALYRLADRTGLVMEAVTELTDEHGGTEVGLAVRHDLPFGAVHLNLEGGVRWQDSALSSYLWGVSASEARAGRSAYDPDAGVIPHLSVSAAYPLEDRSILRASIRADFLPDSITDSPLVDENVQVEALIGVAWNF